MERGHMGKNLLQEVGKELMGKCERTLLEGLINCFIDNLRAGNLEFIALAAHCFNKNGKVKLTSAGNLEGVG